jgi:UDP-2-acetamido-3-amino-2,3-dideoxy-glucuronate N-acetyltransferase
VPVALGRLDPLKMSEYIIHTTALVESDRIGSGTKIWAFTHVLTGARIGERCNIGDHCFIESGAVVGNDVTIKNGNAIWDGVTIENGVFVGPGVVFTNDLYPRSARLAEAKRRYEDRAWLVETRVEEGATLGAGAVILAGVKIGQFAMIAAGSVVTREVPRHALVAGNPARRMGWMCACGARLDLREDRATCPACRLMYKRTAGRLVREGPVMWPIGTAVDDTRT